jgi:hypothetical protein
MSFTAPTPSVGTQTERSGENDAESLHDRRNPADIRLGAKIRDNWNKPEDKETEFGSIAELDDNEPDIRKARNDKTDIAINGEIGYIKDAGMSGILNTHNNDKLTKLSNSTSHMPEWLEKEIEKRSETELKEAEKGLIMKYPYAAYQVFSDGKLAQKIAAAAFGKTPDAGIANAYQHAYWNALMVCSMGEQKAELFATAHEDWPENILNQVTNGFTYKELADMDRYNNAVGRKIGAEVLNDDNDPWMALMDYFGSQEAIDAAAKQYGLPRNYQLLLAAKVMDALKNGDLAYLVKEGRRG